MPTDDNSLLGGVALLAAIGAVIVAVIGSREGSGPSPAGQTAQDITDTINQSVSGESQPRTGTGTPLSAVINNPQQFGDEPGVTGLVDRNLGGADDIVSPSEAQGTGVSAYSAELVDLDEPDIPGTGPGTGTGFYD